MPHITQKPKGVYAPHNPEMMGIYPYNVYHRNEVFGCFFLVVKA